MSPNWLRLRVLTSTGRPGRRAAAGGEGPAGGQQQVGASGARAPGGGRRAAWLATPITDHLLGGGATPAVCPNDRPAVRVAGARDQGAVCREEGTGETG